MQITTIESIDTLLRIAKSEFDLYTDLDGVLTNFNKGFENFGHGTPEEFEKENSTEAMWYLIQHKDPHFFLHLEWMPDGKELWNFIKQYNPTILTKPARMKYCKSDKEQWIKKNLGKVPYIITTKKEKYAHENAILIDDMPENIETWEASDGIGILHVSTNSTINKLKELISDFKRPKKITK